MLTTLSDHFGWLDGLALAFFVCSWFGYGWFTEYSTRRDKCLVGASHAYRLTWAKELLCRENRIVDSALVGNLMQSVSFYANTTIYIIAGLLAAFGALDHLMEAAAQLPFTRQQTQRMWEVKLVLLTSVFVVAYFKFTWSLRQFNLLSILIGAAPNPKTDQATRDKYAERMAAMNTRAGDDFYRGIRDYYFGLTSMSWFLHPGLLIAATFIVLGVLYRRDFKSNALDILQRDV